MHRLGASDAMVIGTDDNAVTIACAALVMLIWCGFPSEIKF
jgi:hypothetical protein